MRRPLIVLMSLSLAGCSAWAHYSDPRRASRIDDRYAERDACLTKNAAAQAHGGGSVVDLARTISLNCQAETDALNAVSNPAHDPKVAAAIERDTQRRAQAFIVKARNAPAATAEPTALVAPN